MGWHPSPLGRVAHRLRSPPHGPTSLLRPGQPAPVRALPLEGIWWASSMSLAMTMVLIAISGSRLRPRAVVRKIPEVQCMSAAVGLFEGRVPFIDPLALEKRIPLGDTGLTTAPLGLGTWAWGNQLLWGYTEASDPELRRAFDEAVTAGINFFDTGDSYGTGKLEGQAERLLGRFRSEYAAEKSAARAANVVLATKLAVYPWRLTGQSFEAACRASLARMGRSQLEVAQAHWSPANYAPWQEAALWDGLCRSYEAGLCRAVGASNFGPRQLRRFAAYCRDRGVPLVLNQVQFSLLSTAPLDTGLVEVCGELGITVVAYSPLALGTLSGKYTLSPDGRRAVPAQSKIFALFAGPACYHSS
eukprot:TRINITY_DN1318_c0_g1_i2.p1 TRINITY_DN1318_c0_g1~~TRINITY_DN1318_c0_g1_i2.p1  ORF type:complete len:359 (-),score=46.05 TRINITY_DN1318_c0_g1_i2:127-1203(-)